MSDNREIPSPPSVFVMDVIGCNSYEAEMLLKYYNNDPILVIQQVK